MKKKLLIIPLLFIIFLAGCNLQTSQKTVDKNSFQSDSQKVEETQQKVQKSVPIPTITTSAERQNIASRAKLFDNESKITYIYLINYGKVMAFYTVKGKVSSLNSYLSPIEKLVYADGSNCDRNKSSSTQSSSSWEPCYTVQASDIDGAYGENADGIFFFTTDNIYVEWSGDYMVSDQALKLTTQPELIREIK